jgi:hypothetical protein
MSSTEPEIPSGAVFSIAPPSPMSSESEDEEYEYHLEVKVTTSYQNHPAKVYPNKLEGRIINQNDEFIGEFELLVSVIKAEIAIYLIINEDDRLVSEYLIPRFVFPLGKPSDSTEQYRLEVKVSTSEQDHPEKVYPNEIFGRIYNQRGEFIGEFELGLVVFQAALAICLIINDEDELLNTFTIPRWIIPGKNDGKANLLF